MSLTKRSPAYEKYFMDRTEEVSYEEYQEFQCLQERKRKLWWNRVMYLIASITKRLRHG